MAPTSPTQPDFTPGRCIIPVVTDDGSQSRKAPRAVRNLGRRSRPVSRRSWLAELDRMVHLAIWTQ
jgi:hypothetical protein